MGAVISEARFPLRIDWERVQALPEWQRGGSLADPDGALACFPLRSEWEATLPVQRDAFPGPLRASRSAKTLPLVPQAALKLSEAAREASWDVRTQYARGHFPHATTGRPGALKESFALRFGGHPVTGRQAYAVYSRTVAGGTWSWSSIMIWGPDLPPYAGCSLADLRQYLSNPTIHAETLLSWVFELKRAAASTEEARKRRTRIRMQIRKVASEGRFEAARQETRQAYDQAEQAWKGKIMDLADGVFTSEEVAKLIEIKAVAGGLR